jgi:hypothetical protein
MKALLLIFMFLTPEMALHSAAQQSTQSTAISARWLLTFKHKAALYETYDDPKFLAVLRQGLPHYTGQWPGGHSKKLAVPEAAAYAVSAPGSVTVESNRYVTITGTMPLEGEDKGLLWCDTAAEHTTMIFAYMWQNLGIDHDASGTLDIYTKHKANDAPLPPQFVASINAWEKETKVTRFTRITIHDAEDHTAALPFSALSPQPNS